jgi:hypothetical protein
MEPEAVSTFIRLLAHREHKEVAARVRAHGSTTEICYGAPMDWPWPRQFTYKNEYFCVGSGLRCVGEVSRASVGEAEHVVNFFSADLELETRHFIDAGYVQAWVSLLLGRSLRHGWNRPLAQNTEVHEVGSAKDMERYASLPGISNPGTARDPSIHNFFATIEGEVVAKGQVLLQSGSVAYVSDMFSRPDHRRKGLCNTIMSALEAKARSLGATHVCLAPGYEVASYGLYEKYGYQVAGYRAVLIPGNPSTRVSSPGESHP